METNYQFIYKGNGQVSYEPIGELMDGGDDNE